ncbi:S41 family peptidase [Hyphococcus sp.]|jgi:C-terminal processing protease CtpA/Prc|uniref:S41 family peptidase n=1 Tax=Hyphococcus sp. TaxID=2038636 RepID=UPI003D0A9C28
MTGQKSWGSGFVAFFILLTAAGCGGGGNNAPAPTTPPPPPPAITGPTWTAGVYEDASRFKDRCETVRTGLDLEGNPYPDRAGSTLEENFWLRSWTHETYLWNDEVTDRNPANYSNPIAYFDVLKTNATTPSGKDKDDFHFSQPTEEFLRERNSTPTAEYGASLIAYSVTPPRDFRVIYTEPGTPASDLVMGVPNLIRGTKILEVDGVDLVNADTDAEIEILNDGLFPATAGEMHSFVVQDPGAVGTRTIMMISENLAPPAVNRTAIINTPTGDVGYVLVNTFSPFASEKDIRDAIADMATAGVSDLVLDLRYNGGGLLAISAQLGFMVAGSAQTNGKVFERLRFNDDANGVNPVTGETNNSSPFYSTGLGFSVPDGAPLPSLDLGRVFILSTDWTCSASEAVINGLRGVDVEVILIGRTTCGKPYGFYPEDNCGETYYTIQFQGVNEKDFGDYTDGFVPANSSATFGVKLPGCVVDDDLDHELGDETEAMLAAALQYREFATCPAPPPFAITAKSVETPIDVMPGMRMMQKNRDMRMPGE